MLNITSKTGKQITLAQVGANIVATCGPISFAAVRTEQGFASQLLVREAGNRRIDVILEGADLVVANALFDELAASVATLAAEETAYAAHVAKINRAMCS